MIFSNFSGESWAIESFLPKEILIANDIVDNNGHLKKKIRKVKKAEKITSELKVWNLSFNKTSDLQQVISKIHAFIKDNNEIID